MIRTVYKLFTCRDLVSRCSNFPRDILRGSNLPGCPSKGWARAVCRPRPAPPEPPPGRRRRSQCSSQTWTWRSMLVFARPRSKFKWAWKKVDDVKESEKSKQNYVALYKRIRGSELSWLPSWLASHTVEEERKEGEEKKKHSNVLS